MTKTKTELLHELKRKKEVERKRKIVVDEFYPKLLNTATSVNEAKMLIQAISSSLMEIVLGWMKDKPFTEVLPTLLERVGDEKEKEVTELLNTLKDENIFVAREIIEGMTRALDQMIYDEMNDRKLDTLKADWDRMLRQ